MPKKYFRKGRKQPIRKNKMSFDKRVLSIVNRQRELKVVRQSWSYPIQSFINNTVSSVMPVLPDIPQAGNVGSANPNAQEFYRDGNQINLKKVVIRWWITMNPSANVALARQMIRHMIVRQKSTSGSELIQNPSQFEVNFLLEQAQAFTGQIENFNTPINKAAFVSRYDKRTYISSPNTATGQTNTGVLVPGVLPGGDNNNSFKFGQKTIKFGKGKTITYASGANDYATNFPYVQLMAGLCANGDDTSGITFNYTSTAYFHDS